MEQPKKPFYRETWFQIASPILGLFLLYLILQFMAPSPFAGWVVDGLAFGMMFVCTLALASQYVLPVRTIRERRQALSRIFEYVSSLHGPIVFIRDGQLVGSPEELKRKGAGVILVDGSSGVILERKRRFSRAEGPGIVFTQYKERLAATFDLRKQSRSMETQALTRDGIEVKAFVTVIFVLDPGDQVSPRESPEERDVLGQARITPAFPFNSESAFKAHYGSAVDEKQEIVKWADLPIVVATEYFRDQVSRLTLEDLFMPKDPLALPVVALQTRLTDQVQKAPLLKDRRVKVYSVMVGTLELPEEVMQQRIRTWAARWQKEALMVLANADVEAERIKEKARAEAQAEMLGHFREYISEAFAGDGEASKKDLAQKFVNALNRVASDPVTRMLISSDTMRQLSNLRVWVGLPTGGAAQTQVLGKPASEDLSELVAEDGPDEDDSHIVNDEPTNFQIGGSSGQGGA